MSRKGIRWWLLCEDKTHERFAYSVARTLGLNDRPIDVRLCERGAGSASVIRAYAHLVRTTVRKRPGERLAILVLVDGDNVGVQARHEKLDQALLSLRAGHDELKRLPD